MTVIKISQEALGRCRECGSALIFDTVARSYIGYPYASYDRAVIVLACTNMGCRETYSLVVRMTGTPAPEPDDELAPFGWLPR